MVQSGKYNYFSNSEFQALDLPYGSGSFSMTIFLPGLDKKIDEFIENLNQDNLSIWLNTFKKDSGNIYLPKFKLEYEVELNDVLKALGMPTAFTPMADFTRMYKPGGLMISKVKHKTFVEVNEEGTEAAAATVVEIIKSSIGDKFTMYINRPFIFMIRENNSQTILFIGKVVEIKS
jgi:serpin B